MKAFNMLFKSAVVVLVYGCILWFLYLGLDHLMKRMEFQGCVLGELEWMRDYPNKDSIFYYSPEEHLSNIETCAAKIEKQ